MQVVILLLKASKDAIRRTAGAYILYPGTKKYHQKGFHEIVPGLGAFPISPSNNGEGLNEIKSFIIEVIDHYTNRASKREELSYHAYKINKESTHIGKVHEMIPEKYLGMRTEPPSEMTVLIGYYNKKQYPWIKMQGLYNIRIDKEGGLSKYSSAELEAKYLLLHGENNLVSGNLWNIVSKEAILMSKKELINKGYPMKPSKEYYFVYKIKPLVQDEFLNQQWDIRKLKETSGRGYSYPFAVTLKELMSAKVN